MKFISLRWKLSAILFISNLFVGAFIIIYISMQLRQNLGTEMVSKGQLIAQNIAQYAQEMIIEEDQVALKQLISNSIAYESVEYILVESAEETLLADTYNGQVPQELQDQKPPQSDQQVEPKVLTLEQGNVHVFDIWHPVEEGYLGYIRVGIRQDFIQQKIQQTGLKVVLTIAVAILLAWILIIYLISKRVINPLMYLTNRADEISQGKLEQPVELKTGDEIELLGDALERLRESVKIALDRLKKHQTMRM